MNYPRDLPTLVAPPTATPLMPQQYTRPGLSLPQVFAIVKAHLKASLLIASAVLLVAGAACALWPRTYKATAALMVNFEVNDPLAGREFPVGLLGSYMSTQVELARSSEVLMAVIDQLGLIDDAGYAAIGADAKPGDTATRQDQIADVLRKNLLIEQGLYGSQLIHVTYSSRSPVEAARIANTVADVYSKQQLLRLTGPASERAKRYTEQLAELKTKVTVAQEQVTAFRAQSGLIDSDAKIDLDMQLLATLEQRLQEAQNNRRVVETRTATDQTVNTAVLSSPMIQALKTQLAIQRAHLAELTATLGPRHPQVLELRSQIGTTHQSLNAEMHAYGGNASAERVAAQQLDQKLQLAVNEAHARMITVRQLQDNGAKYQLALDAAQSVYKRALDGYDQVMFASTGGYTNIDFVSRATPPSKPAKPKIKVAMVLAVVAAIVLALGLPMCLDLFNRRVRCRDDIERDHGIPVLAELGLIGRLPEAFPGAAA